MTPANPAARPARRSLRRAVVHAARRGHLFCGLFLLPWVVLYGLTAFLFNHPTAFPDQQVTPFGLADVAGTRLEGLPGPAAVADQAVAALNAGSAAGGYRVVRPEAARYAREFAFATAKAGGDQHSVLVAVADGSGVVRSKPAEVPPPAAPFARKGLAVPDPLHERVKAGVSEVLARKGLAAGEVTVTSVPDVAFLMAGPDGRVWRATVNPQTGAVAGVEGDSFPPADVSVRRYLLRLHTAHGYPAAPDARSAWAVVVDLMAAVMLFWAGSGLVMWWQVKAARRAGVVALGLSAAAAAWLAIEMYAVLTR